MRANSRTAQKLEMPPGPCSKGPTHDMYSPHGSLGKLGGTDWLEMTQSKWLLGLAAPSGQAARDPVEHLTFLEMNSLLSQLCTPTGRVTLPLGSHSTGVKSIHLQPDSQTAPLLPGSATLRSLRNLLGLFSSPRKWGQHHYPLDCWETEWVKTLRVSEQHAALKLRWGQEMFFTG